MRTGFRRPRSGSRPTAFHGQSVTRGLGLGSLLLASTLALAASCSDAAVDPSAQASALGTSALQQGVVSLPSFVTAMEGSLENHAFRGRRRAWERPLVGVGGSFVHASDADRQQSTIAGSQGQLAALAPKSETVITLEDVGSDGDGGFAIELLDAIQLPPGVNDILFPVSFESGVDARWRIREFRVRDLDILSVNYAVSVTGATTTVAGIDCQLVSLARFEAIGGRPGRYELAVDPATGFVLRMEEFSGSGESLSGFEYETFEYGGSLSDMTLRRGSLVTQPIDLELDLATQFGFRALTPEVFPSGFELVDASRLTVPRLSSDPSAPEGFLPSGEWARFSATDGIELMSFAHGPTDEIESASAQKESVVRMTLDGAWHIGFANVRGVSLIVTGRVSMEDLRLTVESAF